MTQTLQTGQTFRIHVIAASPAAPLAILSIASILGIEPQLAAQRLASLPTVLAENVADPEARRLSTILTACGFQVRLDPVLSLPERLRPADQRRDLAIQPRTGADMVALAPVLAAVLDLNPQAIHDGLCGPQGFVLHDETTSRIDAIRRALRREKQLRLLISEAALAEYDGFAVSGHGVPVADLRRLGLGRCRFSGAIAAAMNAATARHLARRAAGGIVVLNRDFQRFDLFLTATPDLSNREVADFLASRCREGRLHTSATLPCRIEADLPRRLAEAFAADYAAIGIEVRAQVRGAAKLR